MICKLCSDNPEAAMKLASVWDDPEIGVAYNVHHCLYCGALAIEHVWKNPGVIWVSAVGNVKLGPGGEALRE